MRRSVLSLALCAVVLSVGAVGCSKSDNTATTNTTLASASSNSNSNSNSSPTTASGNGSSGGAAGAGNVSIPNVTIPGGGDVNKTVADAQKCADLLTGYSGLFAPLMGADVSSDTRQKAETALENMKSQVPDKISKDLDTIESGIKNANDLGSLSTFLTSDAYNKANTEITDYFTNQCSKVGQ